MHDTFNARTILPAGERHYEIFRLGALESGHEVSRLPTR